MGKSSASNGVVRTFDDELRFVQQRDDFSCSVAVGMVPDMRVPGVFYANAALKELVYEELRDFASTQYRNGGAQRARLRRAPRLCQHTIPQWRRRRFPTGSKADCERRGAAGRALRLRVYNRLFLPLGNVAALDMDDPEAVVSPGGVGFDINCGVRLVRTNLHEDNVLPKREELAQTLFNQIPVGVGSKGVIPTSAKDLEDALGLGMDWSLREGYAWPQDKEHCEEYGRVMSAEPSKVSTRAKKRGLPQLGTLGAGNHYAEVQVVDEIFDKVLGRALTLCHDLLHCNWQAAGQMGIGRIGQVCIMIHSGSRGLGDQVATDALVQMDKAMARDQIATNDRQLACARIQSQEGQDYLSAMAAAANCTFAKVFASTPDDLDMHVIYDVSHNIAKVETHVVDGKPKRLLVHRKGATRAFPPHHPLIPVDYQSIGQSALISGTMGTSSYVLLGTQRGMDETFGSTCHGAGRALSRNKSRRSLDYARVLANLETQGISIRVASPKLVVEEAPESYKNVDDVVNTCHDAGISRKAVKLRPIVVVKG